MTAIFNFFRVSLSLMAMLLVPMILYFTIKHMMNSTTVTGKRADIKEFFVGILYFLIVTPISFFLYSFLVKLAWAIQKFVVGPSFSIESLPKFSSALLTALSSETLVLPYKTGAMLAMITLSAQKILLVLGAALLPVCFAFIFVGSSQSMKTIGQSTLLFFLMIIFVPLIDAVTFACAELALEMTENAAYLAVSTYWLVGALNLLLFFMAFSVSKANITIKTNLGGRLK